MMQNYHANGLTESGKTYVSTGNNFENFEINLQNLQFT